MFEYFLWFCHKAKTFRQVYCLNDKEIYGGYSQNKELEKLSKLGLDQFFIFMLLEVL